MISFLLRCLCVCICFYQAALSAMTPDEALQTLMEGNKRYVSDKLLHPDRTSERRDSLITKQTPFVAVLGCSDSRVAPEIIFDQGIGDIFTVRVAGNVAADVELDSIEFATGHLGACLLVVMGHENCGAVKAVMDNQAQDIPAVARLIQPAVTACKKSKNPLLGTCVQSNVKNVVDKLSATPVLANLIKQKKLKIVGAYYALDTGAVEILP